MKLDAHVRPERGLDIGAASWGGVEFAWISSVGEVAGTFGDWWASWGGGLVTTCGLDNVGTPSDGLPQHGTYTYLAATDVSLDGGEVRGTIDDPRGLRVSRTIGIDEASLSLRDVTINLSDDALPAPLLYHCNFLWDAVEIDAEEVLPRDEEARAYDWRESGDGPERVYEHLGWRSATVFRSGLRITIRSNLPRLWQWIDPRLGVLGIEPANCSVLGRTHDRARGELPILRPGEERVTTLDISIVSS
jgi:hypothetical protein